MQDEFQRAGAVLFGVSPDGEASHRKFRERQKLPFELLVDTDHAIADRYGVWQEKRSFGVAHFGIVRSHFVVDPEGTLAEARVPVGPDAGPELALEAVLHDARLRSRSLAVADPEPPDCADAEVLENDVRLLGQPEEDRASLRMLQIERQALLVSIQVDEIRRFAAIKRRSPGAGDIAVEWFDLDDVRAVVAQQRRRKRAGERVRQIQYRDIVQGQHEGQIVECFAGRSGMPESIRQEILSCATPSSFPWLERRSVRAGAGPST